MLPSLRPPASFCYVPSISACRRARVHMLSRRTPAGNGLALPPFRSLVRLLAPSPNRAPSFQPSRPLSASLPAALTLSSVWSCRIISWLRSRIAWISSARLDCGRAPPAATVAAGCDIGRLSTARLDGRQRFLRPRHRNTLCVCCRRSQDAYRNHGTKYEV